MKKLTFIIFSWFFITLSVFADVVKPALTEIVVNTDGSYRIEVRTSIEALLTGINGQYKNTKEAPNAEKYDELRVLEPEDLKLKFKQFETEFIRTVILNFDQQKQNLKVTKVTVPEPGYTKVPRTSIIYLEGSIPINTKQVTWYYPVKYSDQAVRLRQVDEINEQWHWSQWQWIKTDKLSEPFDLTSVFTKPTLWQTFTTYVISGFEHILPKGLDHILFIVGLFLFSRNLKPLVWQITMFTIAHSLTLGLAMLNIINMPAVIVEPLIALSIAYVAIENILINKLSNKRLFIIFAFGLLHGLGFASVLTEFGLPKERFASALISFNLGVEFAQLSLVLALYWLISKWIKSDISYRKYIVVPVSLSISFVALFWTWQRLDVDQLLVIFS